MLTYHVQYDKQEELQTLDTADGKGEKSQEEYREKILEKELHNNLQEINKKNIENWGTYRRILEEKSQTALVMPKTMEEKRIETLKALHAPEELLLEYKKEALAQKEQQEEAGKRMFEKLPEETRKVFELIESYQKSQDGHELTGIVKNDVRALQRDTHMILNHAEQRIKTEESQDVIQEREETERVVERWNYQNQKQSMQKNVHDTKKEISMVHKQMNQSIEEEVLQQLLEQNRSLVQKQIQNEVVHKEQVTVRKIENKEEKHIVQNHMKDITEMIDQGVKRQIGTISDQVYQRLERKLSNEKKRRGF